MLIHLTAEWWVSARKQRSLVGLAEGVQLNLLPLLSATLAPVTRQAAMGSATPATGYATAVSATPDYYTAPPTATVPAPQPYILYATGDSISTGAVLRNPASRPGGMYRVRFWLGQNVESQ
jgi:hypothetical protein